MVVPFVVRAKDIDLFESLDDLENEKEVLSEDDASVEDVEKSPQMLKSSSRLRKFRASHEDSFFQSSCMTLPEHSSMEGLIIPPQSRCSSSSGTTTGSNSCFASFSSSSPRGHKRRNKDHPRRSSNSSSSSSASSVCSKTFEYEDSQHSSSQSSATRTCEYDMSITLSPNTQGSRRSKKSLSKLCHKQRRMHIKPKKSVAFTEMVQVQLIPDIEDYSPRERDQVWYSAKELNQIKIEAQALIQDAKHRRISATASELRGIHMTQKRQRRSNWATGLQCVLDEQEKLRDADDQDRAAEKLARMYKSFAFTAMQFALKMAQEDALAAQQT